MTVARSWSCMAPVTISAAEAEYSFMRTQSFRSCSLPPPSALYSMRFCALPSVYTIRSPLRSNSLAMSTAAFRYPPPLS